MIIWLYDSMIPFLIKAVQMIHDLKCLMRYKIQETTLQSMKMSKRAYSKI